MRVLPITILFFSVCATAFGQTPRLQESFRAKPQTAEAMLQALRQGPVLEGGRKFELTDSTKDMFGWRYKVQTFIYDLPIYNESFTILTAGGAAQPKIYFGAFPETTDYQPLAELPKNLQQSSLSTEKVAYWSMDGYERGQLKTYLNLNLGIHAQVLFGLSGEIIHYQNLASNAGDTVVSVSIFLPNPIVAAMRPYGVGLRDSSDKTSPILETAASTHNLTLRWSSSNSRLLVANDYASMIDQSAPLKDTFTIAPNQTEFTRNKVQFEGLSALFHLTNYTKYLDAVNLNPLDRPVAFDPHSLNNQDQSLAINALDTIRLLFGEGGVDDAEDGDVVVHEFGHGISNCLSPGTNSGFQRQAIDEAFGDYLAKAYHRSISNYAWADVFNWDGHNEYWNGRSVVTTKHYPEDLGASYHLAGELWSSTLMQLHDDIGRTTLDSVLFFAWRSLNNGMSMTQVAELMVDADSVLFNKANRAEILLRFRQRGILAWPAGVGPNIAADGLIHIMNSAGFAAHESQLCLRGLQPETRYSITVSGMDGRVIEEISTIGTAEFYLSNRYLPGVYTLSLREPAGALSFQIVSL